MWDEKSKKDGREREREREWERIQKASWRDEEDEVINSKMGTHFGLKKYRFRALLSMQHYRLIWT